MPLKRALHLLVLGLMVAVMLAACGDSTNTPATSATTASTATTAASSATTAAMTTAASAPTTAAMTTAATTATTTATTATTAATTATTTAATSATTASATTAAPTTATSATTAATSGNAGSFSLSEDYKPDGKSGKKGGQIVYTFAGQFPSTLMPYYQTDNVAQVAVEQIYAALVGQTNNGKYYAELIAQLPTTDNGGVKVGADGKTMDLSVKLKPGLKWSDGSPLTSKDLLYTWKWANDPDNSGFAQDLSGFQAISGIDTPDDTTVVMHFKQVYGPYLNFLNGFWPLPEKVWGKISLKDSGAEKSPEADQPTVTSGPMKVDEFVADDRITLSRNDNFTPVWGFSAYLDKVIFRNTPDSNAAIAAVTKGDIDEAENLDEDQYAVAAKVPNATSKADPEFTYEFLQFNLSNPLFQDKNVRLALLQALDRDALIKQFRPPTAKPLSVTAIVPLSSFYDTTLATRKFDVEAAKKLLDDAGWKVGSDGTRAKDGKKLAFTLASTSAPVRVKTAEVMLTYWKAIGVDVKFQPYKSTEFFGPWNKDGILSRGKYDVGMFAQTGAADPDSAYNNYVSTTIPTDANKGNGNNYGRINDKTIDQAFSDQRTTVDQAKRLEAFKSFQKALYDNTYEAPPLQPLEPVCLQQQTG